MSDSETYRLRMALAEIRGLLAACISPHATEESRIGLIKDAYETADDAEKAFLPHVHRASRSGNDACALCGHDLRHEIHARR